jgi:Mn2+/Fe2+ NRAMP family transporter
VTRRIRLRRVVERPRRRPRTQWAMLAAVLGPGLLAGLSDDDPAGITTYSVLGADYGYTLLWVLLLATVALIVFHEIGARLGVLTGQGLTGLIRERFGVRWAALAVATLLVANVGTMCAEFAGVAAALDLIGVARQVSVPLAAVGVSALVLRGGFHRIEHVLLALSAIFVTYIVAGVLAEPDWSAAAHGLVVPHMSFDRDTLLTVTATVGTTLAPWGLAFIQSYAVDKRLTPRDLPYERVDVVSGALMTGIIGFFVVIACAATLHQTGTSIDDAGDAAAALEPFAGRLASALFGAGLLGAALLAASVLPLSTAYSVSEAIGVEATLDDPIGEARIFYAVYGGVVAVAAAIVLIPSVPLVPVLFGTQALNAVLLVPLLVFVERLARDRDLLGEHANGPFGRAAAVIALVLVTLCVVALLGLAVAG